MRFLDPDWINALGERVSSADVGELSIVIQQVIADTGGGEVAYFIEAGGGTVGVQAGHHDAPTVVMRQDRDTAEAIRGGQLNALTAFQQGLIDVSGDVQALIDARPALEAIDAAASTLP